MTQVFQPDGTHGAGVGAGRRAQHGDRSLRTPERDGYSAVQVGAGTAKNADQAAAGPAQGPAGVRDVREFGSRTCAAYEVGQTLDVTCSRPAKWSTSPACPRARASRAPSSATTSGAARRRTAPTPIGQPGSIGGGTTPGKVFKGTPHVRPHGQRPGHRQGRDHPARRCRARAPARSRDRCRAHATRWSWSGRSSDARHHHPLHQGRRRGRHGRPARGAVRRARQHGGAAPGRRRPAGRPPTGTADTKTRGEVRGGGKKPYRQKGTGRARQGIAQPHPTTRAAAWSSGRTPARYVQRLPKRMRRLALQGALTSKFADGAIKFVATSTWTPSRPASWSATSPPSRRSGRCSWSRPARTSGWSCRRATCRACPGHPRRLAQRGRRPQRRHAGHHPAVHRRRWPRCTHDAPRIAGHPAPGHQREVDGRDAAAQVHVRGARRRQQAPDQARPSRSSSRSRCWTSTCPPPRPRRRRRNRQRGRIKGYTSPWKKAIVTVKSTGQRSNSSRGCRRCRCAVTSRPPPAGGS